MGSLNTNSRTRGPGSRRESRLLDPADVDGVTVRAAAVDLHAAHDREDDVDEDHGEPDQATEDGPDDVQDRDEAEDDAEDHVDDQKARHVDSPVEGFLALDIALRPAGLEDEPDDE